ncbi:MAG: hypothetical protein JWN33_140 [Candidatus Saccharibacteria bacterium]|nr:hypothetical protein [Candidatus Saccharibacteria bacterium]
MISPIQRGFTIVEAVIIIAIIGVIGLVGYVAYNTFQKQAANESSSQVSTASDVPEAPTIESKSGLDAASATIDDINLDDESDLSQLDSELDTF